MIGAAGSWARARVWFGCATLLVLGLGYVGGWYGRTELGDVYGSDGTAYVDCARAMARGDWTSALNPLWSPGYPALIALVRPLFGAGMEGDWLGVQWLNLGIVGLGWVAFLWCVREMLVELGGAWDGWVLWGAFGAFVTTQMGVDRLAHVTPDRLVGVLFFLSCGLLLRLLRRLSLGLGVGLGMVLGVGFLTKAIFGPLGLGVLVMAGVGLGRRAWRVVPAVVVFGGVLGVYGVALSRVVGRPTLGEAGALNYAWHVNRLHKWVHWEGGADTAEEAWGSGRVARLARWEEAPPEFGVPVHPGLVVGSAPRTYVFHGPIHASYVPYYDPPYWYEGYRRFFRWRYQAIAVAKGFEHLGETVLYEPWFWAVGLVVGMGWRRRAGLGRGWTVVGVAAVGVLMYVAVHLEGRYVAGFLAVLGVAGLMGVGRSRMAVWVLGVGLLVGVVKDQRVAWGRAWHRETHEGNLHWRMGEALGRAGLAPGSDIGVIYGGANLDSDWASMARVEITSEIASGADEDAFWRLDRAGQEEVLGRFREAGARVVVSRDAPRGSAVGWERVGEAPLWIYRF